MTAQPIPRGRHGIDKHGVMKHRYGCFPRAVSVCFGRKLRLGYAGVVKKCYAAADRCEGNRFDFDKPRGGLYECCIRQFCLLAGLRYIDLNDRPQQMKTLAGLWPTSVLVTADHAIPFRDGIQYANPEPYKTAKVFSIVTTYSYKPFTP